MVRPRVAAMALDVAIGLAVIAGIWVVAGRHVEFGSRRGNWVFPWVAEVDARLLVAACVAGILIAILHEVARRAVDARPALVVASAFAVGVAVQLAMRSLYPHTMSALMLSPIVDSFYVAAGRVQPGVLMRDFERIAPTLPLHARVNMPGKVLFYQALRAITENPNVLALVVVTLSSAVGIVLYAIVARVFASRRLGLDAMTLWMILPSKVAHHPVLNVVAPLPAILAVWALVRYVAVPAPWSALAVGALVYVTALFDPLALWLGAPFATVVVHALVQKRMRVRDLAMLVGLAAAACVAVHLTVVVAAGFDLWKRYLGMVTIAEAFNRHSNRPYDVWVGANVKDVALAIGPATTIVFAAACGLAIWRIARACATGAWRETVDPGSSLTLATLMALSILVALGLNRGEVARLWIPVFVPIQVAVAWCAAASHAASRWLVVAGTVAYGVVTIATVGYNVP